MSGCHQDCDQGRRCDCAPAYQTDWRDRTLRKLIHFDIWVMFVFFNGLPRETMSAAAWNAHINSGWFGWTHHIIDLLFRPLEREHCRKAWEWQRELYETKETQP